MIRSTDSEKTIEIITGCYRGRPSECPRALWNFAFAGAAIDPAIITPHTEWVVPLTDQVGQWLQARKEKLIEAPGNDSLAAFFIGINDTSDVKGWTNVSRDLPISRNEQVYDTGIRSFLFLNVPTRDRSPGSLGRPDVGNQIAQVKNFNILLEQRVNAFKSSRNDTSVVLFDTNMLMDEALDNARQFGFTNTTGFCRCSDPGYFWYDSGHITERVHRLIANSVLNELEAMV
ncbi:carbohydrate esterase family 16 protein [Rhizoctonia solani]|uniref:Carbohydrate esterase family 16 protein n=1 Tax=Rhizoctonia solani TaxID=456999 RepID=A0A8H7IJH7_9AGAM|nr:carbohydrate esterase family 16 protein [Rhizoctonia solani]